MKAKNYRASTLYPNTPQTDSMRYVMHVVKFDYGEDCKELHVMAECPMTAIEDAREAVSKMTEKQIKEIQPSGAPKE